MNILFYIPKITKEYGGSYHYSIALLRILTRDKTHTYFVLNVNNDPDVAETIKAKENFHLITDEKYLGIGAWGSFSNTVKRSLAFRFRPLRKMLRYEGFFDALLRQHQIDVIHCPYQFVPEAPIPVIATMHDVQELHFPQFFSAQERIDRAIHHKHVIDTAKKVVVSYEHVKKDVVRLFGKQEHDVFTILLDMERLWIDKYLGRQIETQDALIDGRYLLYPAATWEHKNHGNLIKAVALAKKEIGDEIKIVCTGKQTEYFYSTLEPMLLEHKVENNFIFLGIVSDDQLYRLYMGAHGTIVPTLYEAGSFPLVESIILQRPAISSNVTSLPDTMNDTRFLFDPKDIAAIATMICHFWSNADFYRANLEHVKTRSTQIRFNDALNRLLALYASLN